MSLNNAGRKRRKKDNDDQAEVTIENKLTARINRRLKKSKQAYEERKKEREGKNF